MQTRALLPSTWKNLFYPPEKGEYVYFAGAEEYPFTTSGNFAKAAWAADASMLSYQRYGPAPMPEEDFALHLSGFTYRSLLTGLATGTQGYFAWQDDFAIMAFRGTEFGNLTDSFVDLAVLLVAEPDGSVGASKAHRGFHVAVNNVWDEVLHHIGAYRKAHPRSEICFTGHSLGGALATIALSRFEGGGASLYTFGCPRVGNQAFCQRVAEMADLGIFRFVNGNDPVTHVPPHDFGYSHTAAPFFQIGYDGDIQQISNAPLGDWTDLARLIQALPRAGLIFDLNSPAPAYLADHSPAQYCIRLWNCVAGLR